MNSNFKIRKAIDRGHAENDWLKSWHTFSFGSYVDREHVSFRSLRVINEDIIAPGKGFGTHPHANMEIITYVISGELEHRDSMGNGEIIHSGEFQRMTAGSGITHSEFNASLQESVHLYQIWMFPEQQGLNPSYEQKKFRAEERQNAMQLVASPDSLNGSLLIHQDARIYLSDINGAEVVYNLAPNRGLWLQLLSGALDISGLEVPQHLEASDGFSINNDSNNSLPLILSSKNHASVMLFDLA